MQKFLFFNCHTLYVYVWLVCSVQLVRDNTSNCGWTLTAFLATCSPFAWWMENECMGASVCVFSWNGFSATTIGTGKIVFNFFSYSLFFALLPLLFFCLLLSHNVDYRLSKSWLSGRMHFSRWRTRITSLFFLPIFFFSILFKMLLRNKKKKLRYHRHGYGHLRSWKTDVSQSGPSGLKFIRTV